MYQPGQPVEVQRTYVVGRTNEPAMRSWRSGYVVVADPSPYNKDCVLVVLPGHGVLDNIPFNVDFSDVRPAS